MKKFFLRALSLLLLAQFGLNASAKEKINICYETDENYIVQTKVSIASLLDNLDPEDEVSIYILEDAVTKQSKKELDSLRKIFPEKHFNITHISFDDKFTANLKTYTWTKMIYAKLFIPAILPGLDKCLHVDSDIIFAANVKKIYKTELKGEEALSIAKYSPYTIRQYNLGRFNAGVILMDLKKIRDYDLINKMKMFLLEKQKGKDQITEEAAIYALDSKFKKELNPGANIQVECIDLTSEGVENFYYSLRERNYRNNTDTDLNLSKNTYEPLAFHYCGHYKPWNFYGKREKWSKRYAPFLHDLWFKYYKKAGFVNVPKPTGVGKISMLIHYIANLFRS